MHTHTHLFRTDAESRLCAFALTNAPSAAPMPEPERMPDALPAPDAAAARARAAAEAGRLDPAAARDLLRTNAITTGPAAAPTVPATGPAAGPATGPTTGPAAGPAATPRARLDRDIAESSAIINDPSKTPVEKVVALATFLTALAARSRGILNGTIDTAPGAAPGAPAAATGERANGRPGWNGNRGGSSERGGSRAARGSDDMDDRDDRGGRRRSGRGDRGRDRDDRDDRDDRGERRDRDDDRGSDRRSDRGADRPRDGVEFDRDDPRYVDNVAEGLARERDFREGKLGELEDVQAERRGIDDEIDDLMMEKRRLKREKRGAGRDEREEIQERIDEINDRLRDMRAEVRGLKADARRLNTEIRLSGRYERDLSREGRRRETLLARNAPADGRPAVSLEGATVTAAYPEGTDLSGIAETLRAQAPAVASALRVDGNELSFPTTYEFWEQQVIRTVMEGLKRAPEARPTGPNGAPEAAGETRFEGFPTFARTGEQVRGRIVPANEDLTITAPDGGLLNFDNANGNITFRPLQPGNYIISNPDGTVTAAVRVEGAPVAAPEAAAESTELTAAREKATYLMNVLQDMGASLDNPNLARALAELNETVNNSGARRTEVGQQIAADFKGMLDPNDGKTYELSFMNDAADPMSIVESRAAPASATGDLPERAPETPELIEARRLADDLLSKFEYQDEAQATAALEALNTYVAGLPVLQRIAVVGTVILEKGQRDVPKNDTREMHRLSLDLANAASAPFVMRPFEAAPEADPSGRRLEVPETAVRGEAVRIDVAGTATLELFIDEETGVTLDPLVRTENADFILEPVAGSPGSFDFTANRPGSFAFNATEFFGTGVPPRKVLTVS